MTAVEHGIEHGVEHSVDHSADLAVDPALVPDPGTIAPAGSLAARILIAPIRFYRHWISPALPPSCRFTPSCSAYAVGALREHGAVRGLWLAVRRLSKCHPWHAGGYDPVPARPRKGTTREQSQEAREA